MRIGKQLTTVQFGDVTLHASLTWKSAKEIKRQGALLKDDEAAACAFVEQRLCELVDKVENLQDKAGVAVEKLTVAILDDLPAAWPLAAFTAILGSGEVLPADGEGNAPGPSG